MAKGPSPTYPVDTIAKLLRLTKRRVQQLTKEGVIPRAERGRYELAPAVQGYIGYLQDRAAPNAADGNPARADYHAEKARMTKAQADIAEMQAAKLRGELVEAADISQVMSLISSEIRAKLLNNTPVRIATRSKSVRKESEIRDIAKEEITEALRVLAETDPLGLMKSKK